MMNVDRSMVSGGPRTKPRIPSSPRSLPHIIAMLFNARVGAIRQHALAMNESRTVPVRVVCIRFTADVVITDTPWYPINLQHDVTRVTCWRRFRRKAEGSMHRRFV